MRLRTLLGHPRADLALAVAGTATGAGLAALAREPALGIALSAVAGAALGLLIRAPTAAWLVATAVLAASAATTTALDPVWVVVVPLHAFGAAWRLGRREAFVAGGALVVATIASAWTQDSWVPFALIAGSAWGVGRGVRVRDDLAAGLAERAHELEQEREAYSELSVRYERARIASELHDIVAHAISVMVVQASAGRRLVDVDPEATAETFDAIAAAARQAEQDMGRLVALLADEQPRGPEPDLALVEELVARAAGSGLDVSLRLAGDRADIDGESVDVAYRVVRESLTNALRYAAGAPVRVEVRGTERALEVEVANAPAERAAAELAGHGGGRGLMGLHEHVGACGGRLEAGPTPEGGWRVAAVVPRAARRVGAVAPA
ncbi:MAG TPA: histidine kinase [Solirubrobacteraceae bacterium]